MEQPYPPPRKQTVRRAAAAVGRRIDNAFSLHGWAFRRLAVSHSTNVAGDTMVALALADTLFFSVPTVEARTNVVTYLLLTLAPFALIGPLLGNLFQRMPSIYRAGMAVSSLTRMVVALLMMGANQTVPLLLYAFVMLVMSRIYGIGRSAALPTALPDRAVLVSANARLARLGIIAGVIAAPVAAGANRLWSLLPFILATVLFAWSGVVALALRGALRTGFIASIQQEHGPAVRPASRRILRHTLIATAIVRLLNGYLLFLMAFALREEGRGAWSLGVLLLAAGMGFMFSSYLAQFLVRRLREEPMIMAALAVEAAAAFIGGYVLGVAAAVVLAFSAGLAWGTAKFGYDGQLHAGVAAAFRGRAFTRSETFFQLAWVVGAVIPVLITIPTGLGLILAGCAALAAQVTVMGALVGELRANQDQTKTLETPG